MRFFLIAALCPILSLLASCKAQRQIAPDSELREAVTLSPKNVEIESALNAKMTFWLNLDTNRMVMLENGIAVKSWNVATGDVTGQFHNGEPNLTPSGIFNIHRLEICPPWNPALKGPDGKTLPYKDLQKEYEAKKDLYGSCGKNNPLGQFVMWFYKSYTYGLHGNNAEWILAEPAAESRRVSGGCVRNPNATIREVFLKVMESYSQSGAQGLAFKKYVSLELAKSQDKRANVVSEEMSFLGVKVIIGKFGKKEYKLGQRWDFEKGGAPSVASQQKPTIPKDPKDSPETKDSSPSKDSATDTLVQELKKCSIKANDPEQMNLFVPAYGMPSPAIRHEYLWFASKGDEVVLMESSGDWSKINLFGQKGWVKTQFLQCSKN